MVDVGNRVQIESEKVGSVTRTGTVTGVDGRMITVRWDTGGESVIVPSAGCLHVIDDAPAQGQQPSPTSG